MGLGRRRPRARARAGGRHPGGGLTPEDRIGGAPKDESCRRPTGDGVDDRGGGKMAVSPDETGRLRPLVPQMGAPSGQEHGMLDARGALAWAETGHDQGA